MLTGSFLCQAVTYEVDADTGPVCALPLPHMPEDHASAFSSVMPVPRQSFRWVGGEDLQFVRIIRRQWRERRPLRDAAPMVSCLRRPRLPSSFVGFFNGAVQPHLDQMQHASFNDATRHRI
jgi:hypothetical protein